jgi:hypothetical protein
MQGHIKKSMAEVQRQQKEAGLINGMIAGVKFPL